MKNNTQNHRVSNSGNVRRQSPIQLYVDGICRSNFLLLSNKRQVNGEGDEAVAKTPSRLNQQPHNDLVDNSIFRARVIWGQRRWTTQTICWINLATDSQMFFSCERAKKTVSQANDWKAKPAAMNCLNDLWNQFGYWVKDIISCERAKKIVPQVWHFPFRSCYHGLFSRILDY